MPRVSGRETAQRQKGRGQHHVQCAYMILYHQGYLPRAEGERSIAERRHRLSGDELHGIQPCLLRFIIVQAGQVQLIGTQPKVNPERQDERKELPTCQT